MGFLSQIEAPNLSVGMSLATLLSIAEALQVPPSRWLALFAYISPPLQTPRTGRC